MGTRYSRMRGEDIGMGTIDGNSGILLKGVKQKMAMEDAEAPQQQLSIDAVHEFDHPQIPHFPLAGL